MRVAQNGSLRASLALLVVVMTATPTLAESSLKSKWLELFSSKPDRAPTSGKEAENGLKPKADRGAANGSEPRIEWRVVNPFRFFNDARDTERHARAYEWLTDAEKQDPVLNIERKLAGRAPSGWAADMHGATCWDRNRNRHRYPDGSSYIHPKSHVVRAAIVGTAALAGKQ